jgi:hypothetical protein
MTSSFKTSLWPYYISLESIPTMIRSFVCAYFLVGGLLLYNGPVIIVAFVVPNTSRSSRHIGTDWDPIRLLQDVKPNAQMNNFVSLPQTTRHGSFRTAAFSSSLSSSSSSSSSETATSPAFDPKYYSPPEQSIRNDNSPARITLTRFLAQYVKDHPEVSRVSSTIE